jgi:hypothetical protein
MSSDAEKGNLTDGLDKQSYEIQDELKIRKILENHTDWQFEFTKNDKFAYDLRITEWDDEPASDSDNRVLGYVELERARKDKPTSWITGDIPDSWVFLSFLKRKVRRFDHNTQSWRGIKQDYDRTVYLKFNHALDNCFAAPIESIYLHGETTPYSDGSRTGSYLSLEMDHPDVHYGIDECVSFVEDYMTQREPQQKPLVGWGDSDD